jgi:aminocarboxymuconate-semialdehyde decarboxylase
MVVDAHAHVIVPGLGAEVEWSGDVQTVRYGGREIRSALREFSDVARIVEEQDRAGVDIVVLAPWVNLCGVEVERQNEALASYVSERVWALGTATTADELVEVMRDGRLAGVEIPAAPSGVFLGDESFEDFWSAAEETAALVFVHPSTRGFSLPVMDEHYFWNTLGNPFETTVTAAHMLLSGVFDRHPNLRVLLAHGGGVLPALRGRLAHRDPERDLRGAMKRFLVDTVVHDVDVLRGLVEFFGPDRVLLGSDYPFDMGVERPAEIVRALELDVEDEELILGGNAERLLSRQESPA